MSISRICWDIGGIDPTIVYNRSKKHGLFRVIPIKGASVYGKPVANMPRKRNKNGVYLTEVGTDTAKEQIYNRFTLVAEGDEPLPGAVHFPNNPDIYDLTEAQQLTAEEQVENGWTGGRKLSGTAKSAAMRHSTASCMRWRHCGSAFPAGS